MPPDFYDMSLEEAALMFKGWQDDLVQQHDVHRTAAFIISDIVSRTMGNKKGVFKDMKNIWPLPGDKKDKVSEDKMWKRLRQLEAENKKKNGGGN